MFFVQNASMHCFSIYIGLLVLYTHKGNLQPTHTRTCIIPKVNEYFVSCMHINTNSALFNVFIMSLDV